MKQVSRFFVNIKQHIALKNSTRNRNTTETEKTLTRKKNAKGTYNER